MKRTALLLFAFLVGCATTSTNIAEDTPPAVGASREVERAVDSTVLLKTADGRTFCSGTVIKREKLILTAAHCVEDGEPFLVEWRERLSIAYLVHVDLLNDIALLRPPHGLLSARDGVPIARRPARMGERVFALGHARGDDFAFTMTSGIVSHPHRTDNGHYVQSDAPLVGGMSGGGFYNDRGELLGANLFMWLSPVLCTFSCAGVYQDSPMYGFSYLPLIKDALARQ